MKSSNTLNILCLNIRSIYCNFDLLLAFIATLNTRIDIIILTECWTKKGISPPSLNQYNMFMTTDNINQNDGVVAYVRSEVRVTASEPNIVQGNCLLLDTQELTIVCSYRPPCHSNLQPYLTSLDEILSKVRSKDIVFTGDININTLPCDNPSSFVSDYMCVLALHGLRQGITYVEV